MVYYQTGDLILFNGNGWLSWLLEYFGKCSYSHIGMIIVDPGELKGVYLLDCSISAIQLRPVSDVVKSYDGKCYYRKMIYKRDDIFQEKILNTYNDIKSAPYDLNIFDWLSAKILVDTDDIEKAEKVKFSNPQDTTKFWCSALVAYMYVKTDILPLGTPWTLIAPEDFTDNTTKFNLEFKCKFEPEILIKYI